MKNSVTLLVCLSLLVVAGCTQKVAEPPLSSSNFGGGEDDGFIHLHIIPHTHNDAGWLYTVDSYFKGTNPRGCVECILNNITQALKANPQRKFVYVEQVYFQEWWEQISAETRETVFQLVKNGQLEFLLAGYVMNDEACAYYDDMVEQMTLGHRFIKSTFNRTITEAWHIDPFGHSAAQARLFSEMGFNAWFFERIDYQDFDNRLLHKNLETIWRPQSYDMNTNFILAHVNYMSYYLAPYNWCIDMLCYPEPNLPEVARKALLYVKWVKNQTNFFPTKHILHHVGGDFEWSGNTLNHYQGLETLIDFLNAHPSLGIKAYFSTPRNYSESVYEEVKKKNITISEKNDDFFPYQDVPHAYWTGYFTSKPDIKGMIRSASKYLQGVRKLLTQFFFRANISYSSLDGGLYELERSLSILQHHDAVTGTAKHLVDINYTAILKKGYDGVHNLLLPLLNTLFAQKYQKQAKEFQMYNTSQLIMTGNSSIVAYIYNPSQITKREVRIQVPAISFTIKDENGAQIPYDLFCDESIQKSHLDQLHLFSEVYNLRSLKHSNPKEIALAWQKYLQSSLEKRNCEAFFTADVPTNQLKSYVLTPDSQETLKKSQPSPLEENNTPSRTVELFNGEKLVIADDNKTFVYITSDEEENQFTLDYKYYVSFYAPNQQVSGAYIFRPTENKSVEYSEIKNISINKGDQVIEVRIERELVETRLRFFKDILAETIEIHTTLLPVPIADKLGKEITLNIEETSINNDGVFYTDSNGLEMQKRVRNFRPTYDVEILEPVAGNYYPINSAIYIEDVKTQRRMTIMNDRSQGGSSLNDGGVEIMLQRRILHDDNRGVDEPLNQLGPDGKGIIVQTKHWLFFSKGPQKQRQIQYDLDTQALLYFAEISLSDNEELGSSDSVTISDSNEINYVKLYVRPYSDKQILIRVHNILENQNVTIPFWNEEQSICYLLEELVGESYNQLKIAEIQEVTLDTVQDKQEMLKKKFRWDGKYQHGVFNGDFESIVLRPLEERAFLLRKAHPYN